MKNLILLITMLFAFASIAEVGPIGRSATLDNTGALSGPIEQWFISVQNVSGGALTDGDVVIADFSASGDNGYAVTTSTTAGEIPLCILAEACADDAMCKCQTYGYKSNVNFDVSNASAVAGGLAYISEDTAGSVEYEAAPAATDYPIGIFYNAEASSGDVEMFIRLR